MNSLTELCGLPTKVSEIIGNASLSILDCVVAIPYENTTHRSTDTVASRTNVDARISAYSRARARLIIHSFIHSFTHSTHASMIHRAFARARTSVETRDSSRRAHLDLRRLLVDVDDARRHDDVVARGRLRRRRLSLRIARAASRDACRRETRCAIAARPRYASGRERTRRRAGERDARGGDRARRIRRGFREMN